MYNNLKAVIKEKGYKYVYLADQLFMGPTTFSAKMSGRNKFTLDEAVRLKKILGVDTPIEELFEEA